MIDYHQQIKKKKCVQSVLGCVALLSVIILCALQKNLFFQKKISSPAAAVVLVRFLSSFRCLVDAVDLMDFENLF